MPNLADQIREALTMFAHNGTEPALMQRHRDSLDMTELREYFALFNKLDLLNEFLV